MFTIQRFHLLDWSIPSPNHVNELYECTKGQTAKNNRINSVNWHELVSTLPDINIANSSFTEIFLGFIRLCISNQTITVRNGR